MGAASAVIGKALVLAHWYALKAVGTCGMRLYPKINHHLAPFFTMRLNTAQAVQAVNNVMGHFMGHGVGHAVLIVFGKQPGVIANTSTFALHLIHACTFTTKIKIYID